MSGPIPKERWNEFLGYMSVAAQRFEDLPDGAWFAAMEEDVKWFMEHYGIAGDPHDGLLQYCEANAEEK